MLNTEVETEALCVPAFEPTKRALVVGMANRDSIAYGCAKALRDVGYDIDFTYQNAKAFKYVEPIAHELEARAIKLDLNEPVEWQVGGIWQIDTLVHSVAFAPMRDLHGRVIDCSADGFAETLNTSCYSLIKLVKALEYALRPGASVFTMSYIGSHRAVADYNVMGIAKAALESTVRYLAAELGPRNIKVNAISAGPIRTRAASGINGFDAILQAAQSAEPLSCRLDVHGVGRTVAALAEHAPNVTGQVIYVDNGFSIAS